MSMHKKYPGYGSHLEYHTVNAKKKKAANCIYMMDDRTCRCKESVYYMEKCFISSYCPHRVKEEKPKPQTKPMVPMAKDAAGVKTPPKHICSLPLGSRITTRNGAEGILKSFDSSNGKITISFNEKIVSYIYPDAFIQKHLTVSGCLVAKLEKDIQLLAKR